jgi:hypothetical protein
MHLPKAVWVTLPPLSATGHQVEAEYETATGEAHGQDFMVLCERWLNLSTFNSKISARFSIRAACSVFNFLVNLLVRQGSLHLSAQVAFSRFATQMLICFASSYFLIRRIHVKCRAYLIIETILAMTLAELKTQLFALLLRRKLKPYKLGVRQQNPPTPQIRRQREAKPCESAFNWF